MKSRPLIASSKIDMLFLVLEDFAKVYVLSWNSAVLPSSKATDVRPVRKKLIFLGVGG